MAWFKTNDPATGGGIITDGGQILCQIAFAINEREHMMERTETEWLGGLGSRPGQNDLIFQTVTSTRLLIEEMRGVIDTDLISHTKNGSELFASDASWNHYTFAALYAEAMGGGTDWETSDLTGHRVDDARIFEEMMKCLELLVRWESTAELGEPTDFELHIINKAGSFDTTTAIYNAAIADGIGTVPGRSAHTLVTYAAGPDKYTGLASQYSTDEFYVIGPAAGAQPTSTQLRLPYDIIGTSRDDLDWFLRTISEAEFDTPVWNTGGTERDNRTFTAATGLEVLEYDDEAWVDLGAYNWLRVDNDTTNPFPVDPNTSLFTWTFRWFISTVRFANTVWTFG